MASAPSATRMCGLRRWYACATSATTAAMRAAASSAEASACRMHTTARSARCRKKTETAVPRSSTWVQQRQTCSMSGKSTDLESGSSRAAGCSCRSCMVGPCVAEGAGPYRSYLSAGPIQAAVRAVSRCGFMLVMLLLLLRLLCSWRYEHTSAAAALLHCGVRDAMPSNSSSGRRLSELQRAWYRPWLRLVLFSTECGGANRQCFLQLQLLFMHF